MTNVRRQIGAVYGRPRRLGLRLPDLADHEHTPEAVRAAMTALEEARGGRAWAMGDDAATRRHRERRAAWMRMAEREWRDQRDLGPR